MSDERRERYAAALYEQANPGFRWVDLVDGGDRQVWRYAADAAMAVADAEIQREWEGQQEVIARLRAELEDSRNATKYVTEGADKVVEENDRLRAELNELRLDFQEMQHKAQTNFKCATRDAATIARVRSVLYECGDSESASTIVDEIRAALEGEQ